MHQITLFQDKKSKNFLGRGHPRAHPSGDWGGDTPSPHPIRLDAYGASMLAPSVPRLRLKDDLCFRLIRPWLVW